MTPAEKYEEFFVPAMFGRFADALLARADLRPGQSLLDLACGTGIVARKAAPFVGTDGRVVALDLRPGMLAAARSLPQPQGARIEWVEGDAQATGLPDAAFDRVTCQAGLQFFPDRLLALKEARRLLRPGGLLAVMVWQDLERQGLLHAMAEAEYRNLKPLGVSWDDFNQPFSLGDPDELTALLEQAGFDEVVVVAEEREAQFADPDNFVFNMEYAYAAVIPEFAADSAAFDDFVAAVTSETRELVERHRRGDYVVTTLHANIATGRR